MCDDDGGLAFHEQVERGLYDGLVGGVEGGGGLVEEKHRRVLEDGARDGDTLLLPAADAHPLLARLGLIALGQREQEVLGVGEPRGAAHVIEGRGGAAVLDVVLEGAVEEGRLLLDKANLLPQPTQLEPTEVDTIEEEPAL